MEFWTELAHIFGGVSGSDGATMLCFANGEGWGFCGVLRVLALKECQASTILPQGALCADVAGRDTAAL